MEEVLTVVLIVCLLGVVFAIGAMSQVPKSHDLAIVASSGGMTLHLRGHYNRDGTWRVAGGQGQGTGPELAEDAEQGSAQ